MAFDAALLEGASAKGFQPFFRIYQWSPACISLGRFQNDSTGLLNGALERWPVVRRQTGGGAILHQFELTYSLGLRLEDWPSELGKPTYEQLCQFLLKTWRSFGFSAEFAKDSPVAQSSLGTFSPACFSGQEKHDILVNGKKLGGNAQRRDRDWIFQHGSIPLRLDWDSLTTVFEESYRPLPEKTTDLKSLGFEGPNDELVRKLVASAEEHLHANFVTTEPAAELLARAEFWEQTRYSNPAWTTGIVTSLRA